MTRGQKIAGIKIVTILLAAMLVVGLVVGLFYYQSYTEKRGSTTLTAGEYNLSDTIPVSDLAFTIIEGTNTVKFTGLASSGLRSNLQSTLEIPETVTISGQDYDVVAVDVLNADSVDYVSLIKAVVVPDSVQTIQPCAFEKYVSLYYISVPFIGTRRGATIDQDSPFAAIFSARKTSKTLAQTEAYSKEVGGVTLSNGNNVCPWYRGNNITGATEYYFSLPQNLAEVVITDETEPPDRSFFGIESLKKVTIERIDTFNAYSTFHNCKQLEEVYIPDGTQSLGEYMFGNCISLTTVTIPQNITELRNYMFTGCTSLQRVIVPSTIELINEGAFFNCTSLTTIDRYAMDRTKPQTNGGFNLPNSVEEIKPRAFQGCAFTAIDMSSLAELTSIGIAAFQGCNNITEMTLPFIGKEYNNNASNQNEAMFGYIFGNSTQGTKQAYSTAAEAQNSYFGIPSSLRTIAITREKHVTHGALSNLMYVQTIILNKEIDSIDVGAFEGSVALQDLTVPFIGNSISQGSNARFYTIFGTESKTGTYNVNSYYVPSKLKTYNVTNQPTIYSYALHNFTSLENLTISNVTTTMYESILYNNGSLKTLTIPFVGIFRGEHSNPWWAEWWLHVRRKNSVSWIFSQSTSGAAEYWNDTMRYYDSYRVSIPSSLKELTITDETEIGTWSFRGFKSLTSLSITNCPGYISEACAYDCGSLTTLNLPYIGCNTNPNGVSGRQYTLGWLFGTSNYTNSYSAYEYDYFRLPTGLTNVVIAHNTSVVGGYAFANAKSLTAVTLDGVITQLNGHAFENCSNLAHLVADHAKYSTVGDYAFSGCSKVAVLYKENNDASFIPSTVTQIGNYAFQGTAVSEINFQQFEKIGNYAFRNCLEITELDIPAITHQSVLKSLGEGVFDGCAYLKDVTLGNGTATKSLFSNCVSLESISLDGVTNTIPDSIFSGCTALKTIEIDDATTSIGAFAFYNCSSLESFTVKSQIKIINTGAFAGCTSLVNMTIPRNVTNIYENGWKYDQVECDEDFFFYVYDPEADWPNGWVNNWNCDYPVYIIGQVDESTFTYDYKTALKGYLITGVNDGYVLKDQVVLPTRHNGVKVVGLATNALSAQHDIQVIVLGQYTRVIEDGALQTGSPIKVYIDVDSTSEQVTSPATDDYEVVVGREGEWITYGIVYYGEYWDYGSNNATVPYLLASKFEVTVDDNGKIYYSGLAHEKKVTSIYAKGVIITTDNDTLGLSSHNVINKSFFNESWANNINASTEDKKAQTRAAVDSSKVAAYNETKTRLFDKLYITGTAVGTFNILKKPIDLYSEGAAFAVTYGDGWYNYQWDKNNPNVIKGLDGTNFVFSGTLTTSSENAGTYESEGWVSDTVSGRFTNFRWSEPYKVTLAGNDVTSNFDVRLNKDGGRLGTAKLTVVINKRDVVIDWTGGSWNRTNAYYLWPYTGSTIQPTAIAKATNSDQTFANLVVAWADGVKAKLPTYSINQYNQEETSSTPYTAKASLTAAARTNYNLVEYDGNAYVNTNEVSVLYHVKKAEIKIIISDNDYLIPINADYWSKISTADNPWQNETTSKYTISGINQGSIIEGELRTSDNEAGLHTDIAWVPQVYQTSTDQATLPYHIYRVENTYEQQGDQEVLVSSKKIDENEYYTVTVTGSVTIVYNTFIVKYYVDLVDPENEVIPVESVDGANNRIYIITYQTEGAEHKLIANIENDGVTPDSFKYFHGGDQEKTVPLPFQEISNNYAVGVQIIRKNFVPYYENIHLHVIKSDITMLPLDKQYDGEPINPTSRITKIANPTYEAHGDGVNTAQAQIDSLTYVYYEAVGDEKNLTEEELTDRIKSGQINLATRTAIDAPLAVGHYFVHATAIASDYFNAMDRYIPFEISKRIITINVNDPDGDGKDYVYDKVYDSNVYTIVISLDGADSTNNVLATDQLTGVLKTVSPLPGEYNTQDNVDPKWYWSPQWAVYNKTTKENVTSSYEVVLEGSFKIKNRTIVYEAFGDEDAVFDGYPHKITVTVSVPQSNYVIYYTTSIVESAEQDTNEVKWSQANPMYSTPGTYIVYFKIVSDFYDTVYSHKTVSIIEKTISYTLPPLEIDFDTLEHDFVIKVDDPYYADVYYSENGVDYRLQPYTYKDKGEYKIYYKITADNYKSVEGDCTFVITEDHLPAAQSGTDFVINGYEGFYDKAPHKPTVTFPAGSTFNASNTAIYYRVGESEWSQNLELINAGNYKVDVKIIRQGYKVFIQEGVDVIIKKLSFAGVDVEAFVGDFDRNYHSVTITGLDAYTDYNYKIYYSRDPYSQDSGDGWSETRIRFRDASPAAIPVYIKIEAENFVSSYFSSSIHVKVADNPPNVTPKEYGHEFEYQGSALTTAQIRYLFTTVHDGDIIVKYYKTTKVAGYYQPSTTKVTYAKELGDYYIEVSFLKTNNCKATTATAYFSIVPRTLYAIYDSKVQYTTYKITPVFDWSINDPNYVAPEQTPVTDPDLYVEQAPIVDPIVDVDDLHISYSLASAPDNATVMKELGDYVYDLTLVPDTGNYVLNVSSATITVVPREIQIYVREPEGYDGENPWLRTTAGDDPDDMRDYIYGKDKVPSDTWVKVGKVLDGHELELKMESSSYESQTYTYVANPSGAQNNYVIVTYDVVKYVDEDGFPVRFDTDGKAYKWDEEKNTFELEEVDSVKQKILVENPIKVSVKEYYNFSFDIIVKIVLQELEYHFDDITIEYDGEAHSPMVSISLASVHNARIYYSMSDPEADDFDEINWQIMLTPVTNAQDYDIWILVMSDNYEPMIQKVKFTIKKADIKITLDEFDEIYSDEDYQVTYTATNSVNVPITGLPMYDPDHLDPQDRYNILYYPVKDYEKVDLEKMYDDEDFYNEDYENALTCLHDAGEYWAVVLYKGAENWNTSYSITKVELKRRELHITLQQNVVKTVNYNGDYVVIYLSGAIYDTTDLVHGHKVLQGAIHSLRTISANASPFDKDNKVIPYTAKDLDFNSMYIYDEGNTAVNLYLNYIPVVTNEVSIVINKISFTFTVEGGTFPFSATLNDKGEKVYKLAQPKYKTPADLNPKYYFDNKVHFTYYALKDDGTPDLTNCLGMDTMYQVGEYYVIVTFEAGTNFTAYENTDKGAFVTITPVEVEVKWENLSVEFNNEEQAPTVYYVNVLDENTPLMPYLEYTKNDTLYTKNAVFEAGNYMAYAALRDDDYHASNYVLKLSTLNEVFRITPVIYTIEINETVYNAQTVWTKEVYKTDIPGFIDSLTIYSGTGSDAKPCAKISTTGYGEGLYSASDINDMAWGVYHIVGLYDTDVTNSVVLNAEGFVRIYQDIIKVEIDDSLLTFTYDTQEHSVLSAIRVLNPRAGYTLMYSEDGVEYFTQVPIKTNVGEYKIHVRVSADTYEALDEELTLTINQATPQLTLHSALDRTYNAESVNISALRTNVTGTFNGTNQDLKFEFYECDEDYVLLSNVPLDSPPVNVGYYAIKITDNADGPTANYSNLEKWYYFKITPKTAYLKLDIDAVVTKNQEGYEKWSISVADRAESYMKLGSYDHIDYTISTTENIKRDTFVINTEIKEGNKDDLYYLEGTKYIAMKYYIYNKQSDPYVDNTSNYNLKITGKVTLRFAYLEVEIPDCTFPFNEQAHYATIVMHTNQYTESQLTKKFTYGAQESNQISVMNFVDPGTYTVSYVLSLDGYEDKVGTYKITIEHYERELDPAISQDQLKYYDGVAVKVPQYAFTYTGVDKNAAAYDNFNTSNVTCTFQRVGTNGILTEIKEVGNYTYTLIIPASTYFAETVIVGTYRILAGKFKIYDADPLLYASGKFNENSLTYHYTTASTDYSIKMYNRVTSEYDLPVPDGYQITFDFITNSSAIGTYSTTTNTLGLRNGYIVTDSNDADLSRNYLLEFDAHFVITAGEIICTVSDVEVEYDGQIHMPVVTMTKPTDYTALYYSLTGETDSYTTENIGSSNVGTYTVWLKIVRTNYETAYKTATVTINKATTYIRVPDLTKAYDEKEVLYPSNVETNSDVSSSKWKFSYEQYDTVKEQWFDMGSSRPMNVGRYRVTVEIPSTDGSGNPLSECYKGAAVTKEFNITPITLIMNWNGTTFTYNGKTQIPEYTLSTLTVTSLDISKIKPAINVVNSEDVETTVDPKDVGIYIATAEITQDMNYRVDDNYKTTTYAIQPRTIVVTANQHVTYSGAKFTLNYLDQKYPYTVQNLAPDQYVYDSPLTTGAHVVGEYKCKGKTLESFTWDYKNIDIRDTDTNSVVSNYIVEYDLFFAIDYNTVEHTATGYYGEYDGQPHGISIEVKNISEHKITYSLDQLTYRDQPYEFVDVQLDGSGSPVERTVYYKIKVEGYTTVGGSKTVYIYKQQAHLALASSKPLSKIYDGENIENPAVTYNGMDENPRAVTYEYEKYSDVEGQYLPTDSVRNVGKYRLTIKLDDGSDQNYEGGSHTEVFAIEKRDITIAIYDSNNKPIPQSKVYDGNIMKLTVDNSMIKNLASYDYETFDGTVSTKSALVGVYDLAADFNITYEINRAMQTSGGATSLVPVTENYNINFDLDLRITNAKITYKAEDVEAIFNGYMHKFEVEDVKPSTATIYYWTDDEPTKTTTPIERKYRGETTVYFQIEADNYTTEYDNRKIIITGISTTVDMDTELIYDDSKVYDTFAYMYNVDESLAHPRIVTESTGNQVITYYKKSDPNHAIVTMTYDKDGKYVSGDKALIPTNADDYQFAIIVEADGEYEKITLEKRVSFKITKLMKSVTWSNLTQTYTGQPLTPTATYKNYAGNTIELKVTEPQVNASKFGYQVSAAAYDTDLDTKTNYTLSNTSSTFTIKPIEVEEMNLMTGRKFQYRETIQKSRPVYKYEEGVLVKDEQGNPIIEKIEIDEYTFGDEITILDVQGNKYITDASGNITQVLAPDDSDITGTFDEFVYTITILGDGQASRLHTGSDLQFVVALKDTTNYIWKVAQNTTNLITKYEIDPFNIDNTEDNYEVLVTVPSVVLATGSEVKPTVTAQLMTKSGTLLRDLTSDEFTVTYSNNINPGKNALATVTGQGNFAFTSAHKFEIREEAPERFELVSTATAKFVKYTKTMTEFGESFEIETQGSTMDNPETEIGQEDVFLGRIHQSQTLTDILKQFVRYDTEPELFRVWDKDGNKISTDMYDLTPASTGIQIRVYSKATDADDKYADYVRLLLYGDMNGDGDIDVTDYVIMKNVLLLTDNYDSLKIFYLAGLVDDNSEVGLQTYVILKNYLLDNEANDFNANYLVGAEV